MLKCASRMPPDQRPASCSVFCSRLRPGRTSIPMLFSQRYFPAIENNVLVVDIPDAARRKLWAWLSANNASLGIRRDPNDSWISNSSVLEETERELLIEHGWEHLPVSPHSTNTEYHAVGLPIFPNSSSFAR